MNAITHRQAKRYMRADLDGLLNEAQRRALETHLAGCEACRAESQSLSSLTPRLQTEFRARWDAQDGPSERVLKNIQSQSRRIKMQKRMDAAFNLLGGAAALLVLFFVINSVISIFQKNVPASETQTSNSVTSPKDERLLAFTSQQDGNFEIYTIHADGSGMTNITNNPAYDANPFWSPDGKRIAFQSDRTGFTQIYLMDADGSNVTQLTFDEVGHEMAINDANSNPWSPDGNHLLFFRRVSEENGLLPPPLELYSMNVNSGTKVLLSGGNALLAAPSWSPDGTHIAYVVVEPVGNRDMTRIYVADSSGNNIVSITKNLPPDEDIYNWDFPWSDDGQSITFIADRYTYENGNGKSTLYRASLDGNSLVEIDHVSTHIVDRWDGTLFINAIASTQSLTWLRSDGTHSVLNAYQNCERADTLFGPTYERSLHGNLVIGAGCANGAWWFYWTNQDGTVIKQIFNYPFQTQEGYVYFAWSPDDRYVVFNIASTDSTKMYILDVEKALKDPSFRPFQTLISNSNLYFIPSWQPVP